MKFSILIVFLMLTISINSYADSDGEGCSGNGVIAFDMASKDRTGLYIVLWGKHYQKPKKFRVELPRKHSSYSQGIQCDSDKVSILLRGEPPLLNSKEKTKFEMYLTEISFKDGSSPKIISDKPNHYQIWLNYIKQVIEPLNAETPVISLQKSNLNINNCSNQEIRLQSNDSSHTYYLILDNSESTSDVKNGYGSIHHRCKATLEMKSNSGQLIHKLPISNTGSLETID